MATGMVAAFGMSVAVATGGEGDAGGISCVSPGLGMYMGAQFEGAAGVAGAAQLERRRMQRTSRIWF